MTKLKNILKKIRSKIINTSFLATELFKLYFFNNSRKNILFSVKDGWEPQITKGFRLTRHKISFAELLPENINNFDIVVPLTIGDLKRLADNSDLIIDNPFPIPSKKSIELCDDKQLFNQTMVNHGFGDYIPKMGGTFTYPYILKKRIDDWGENCHIISNSQQETEFFSLINDSDYFCQKLIRGTNEYATHILIKNRKIEHAINIEYVFENDFPIKGKEKHIYTSICNCPYLELFSSILNSIDFNGLCCINYKVIDNRPQIIEINPRFGGSLSPFFFSFIKHLN